MIGLDLDGTLLDSKKNVSPYTRSVLERAIEKGIIVLAATGRPLSGISEQILQIRGMQYALTTNGARVYDLVKGRWITEHPLSNKNACRALEILSKYDTLQEAYFDKEVMAGKEQLENLPHYHKNPYMWDYVRSTRTKVPSVLEWLRETKRDPDKLQSLFADMDDLSEAWAELEQVSELKLSGSLGNNIEINDARVNKGAAILELGQILGICREEIMVCGDSDNDLDMLRMAGLGVAMGNAADDIKSAADYVTGTNDEDGAAKAIIKFALKGGEIC